MPKKCVPYTIRIGELEETSVVPIELEEELAILCSERGRSFLAIFEKGLAVVKHIESGGADPCEGTTESSIVRENLKRIGVDVVRSRDLDMMAIEKWERDEQKLWLLPHGVWNARFILRKGKGVRTMFEALDKTAARAWLDEHGFELSTFSSNDLT